MSRTRIRKDSSRARLDYHFGSRPLFGFSNPYVRDFGLQNLEKFTDVNNKRKRPKNSPCSHYRVLEKGTGRFTDDPQWTFDASNFHYIENVHTFVQREVAAKLAKAKMPKPAFQKDNSFELITFLADWSEFVGTFSKKFVQQMSYGSVNWGVLPLISDIQSLMATIDSFASGWAQEQLKGNTMPLRKRIPIKINKDMEVTVGFWVNVNVEGTVTLNGQYSTGQPDISVLELLAVMLDELGVHPDLRTLWDIVPLSFVVDYFLPVGNVLESIHPRGWYTQPYSYQGTATHNYVVRVTLDMPKGNVASKAFTYKFYSRGQSFFLNSDQQKQAENSPFEDYESPSPKELFNTAYLARQKYGPAKKVTKPGPVLKNRSKRNPASYVLPAVVLGDAARKSFDTTDTSEITDGTV